MTTTPADAREAGAMASPPQPAFPVRRFLVIIVLWDALWWTLLWAATGLAWPFVLTGAVVALAPLVALVRMLTGATYPGAAVRVLVLRPFWYMQLALVLVSVAAGLGALGGLAFGAARVAGAWSAAAAAALFATFALVGYFGSRALVVRRYEASHPALPDAFDGVRIAQLSDLHVGPHTPRGFLARITRAVREHKPHLIAYTGDQVDDHDHDVKHFANAFGDLAAPLGVYAIAGNHDVYAGWTGVRAGLEAMGATVLVNDAVRVEHDGAHLFVAGTGDPAGIGWPHEGGVDAVPDVARTLANVPDAAFTLALAHNPALWPKLAERGVALTLSGHTHHGQLSIPALNWCLASPFLEHAMGQHARGASLLHINPGTNYWGIPLRIGAWPEVSIITLRKGEAGMRPT